MEAPWINARDEKLRENVVVHTCDDCHEDIYLGEEYYDVDDHIICTNCLYKNYLKEA